jgi:acyl carrier protein
MVRKTQSPLEQPGQTVATQVILLQPKATTTDEALASLFKGVQSLHKRIPHLLAVSAGENQSTRHRGFTHGILLHFVDETHLHNALAHQAYLDLQQKISDLCDQAVTFEIQERLPVIEIPPAQPAAPSPPEEPAPKRGRSRQPTSQPSRASESFRRREDAWRTIPIREIDPRLKKIVMDQLGVDESEVAPNASLVEDLNADSLDLVEFIMSVEQAFNIEIADEDAELLTTVGEAQAFLQAHGRL